MYSSGRGFRFSYRVGCFGAIKADYGMVISPGYMAGLEYPSYQQCVWRVESKTGVSMKMIIDTDFGLDGQLGDDILQVQPINTFYSTCR